MAQPTIESLRGEPLSAVAFVQDYVEFHFDGKILRALTRPSLTLGDRSWRFPEDGSRDAFCRLIGKYVALMKVEEGQKIEVTFSDGVVLVIPLGHNSMTGPEAAHFVPGDNQPIAVW